MVVFGLSVWAGEHMNGGYGLRRIDDVLRLGPLCRDAVESADMPGCSLCRGCVLPPMAAVY